MSKLPTLMFLALAALAGCNDTATYRYLVLYEDDLARTAVTPGSPGGRVDFLIHDENGCGSDQSISWKVKIGGMDSAVSAIHIHSGTPTSPGRILLTLPVTADSGVVSEHAVGPYREVANDVALEDMFYAVLHAQAYFDVHAKGISDPVLLKVMTGSGRDWTRTTCGPGIA